MRRARAACAAALLSLAGCVVGPDYQAPTPRAGAGAPLTSIRPAAETPGEPPDAWWRLYSDPRLDGYIGEAFAANADLAVAQANLSGARAALEASKAGRYPATTVALGGTYGRDPSTDEILEILGAKPQTIWVFDDLFDVSYELDLFGHVRRSIEAAHADAQAVAAARDGLKITVAAETARAYAQVCALGEQIAVAHHALEVVGHEAEITANRRAAGAGSEFEEVRADELVAQVRATLPPLEGQRRAALFELTQLVGRTPAHAPKEALDCVTPPRLTSLIPAGDGAALLRRRPDVRQADRRLAGAVARVGVATAELYPRITLGGFYGGVGSDLPSLTTERGLAWGVGPKIAWSFPNQALPRARIRQAEAGEQAALASFDSTVLGALKETEQALSAYGAELDHHQALVEAQTRARRVYELAHDQFLAGAATQLDLLSSEQSLVSSDAAAAASDAALVQDQIAVFKALGGGWGPEAAR